MDIVMLAISKRVEALDTKLFVMKNISNKIDLNKWTGTLRAHLCLPCLAIDGY